MEPIILWRCSNYYNYHYKPHTASQGGSHKIIRSGKTQCEPPKLTAIFWYWPLSVKLRQGTWTKYKTKATPTIPKRCGENKGELRSDPEQWFGEFSVKAGFLSQAEELKVQSENRTTGWQEQGTVAFKEWLDTQLTEQTEALIWQSVEGGTRYL